MYMNSRLTKIRSVHTYVIPRTDYFGWICTAAPSRFYVSTVPSVTLVQIRSILILVQIAKKLPMDKIQQIADGQQLIQWFVSLGVSLELRAGQMSMMYNNGDSCCLFVIINVLWLKSHNLYKVGKKKYHQ